MNINYLTKLQNITPQVKDYALEKAKKVERIYKIRKMDVIMEMEGEKYKVEWVISPDRGSTVVASATEGEWLAAVDNVLDKAERQLRKMKEKVKSHRLRKAKTEAAEPESEKKVVEEETYEKVVDKMKNT